MGSGSGEADQRHHVLLTVAPPPGEADPVPDAAGRPPRLAPVGAMSGFAAGTQGRRPGFGASTADRTRIASRFIFRSGLRMVDPAAKREGVAHLQAELGLPEWGAGRGPVSVCGPLGSATDSATVRRRANHLKGTKA